MPFPCTDDRKKARSLEFRQLECLRRFYRQTQSEQVASINYFAYDVGFRHVRAKEKISVSSTATCVVSLIATNSWTNDKAQTKKLLKHLLSQDTSAGLPPDNPFTTAWILEAVTALEKSYSDPLDDDDKKLIDRKEKILIASVASGGVSMSPYPPSGYLTQLVVRVLRSRGKLSSEIEEVVKKWAWAELPRQLTLIQAKSKAQDAFAVAYLLMLVTAVTPKISPEEASIQRAAVQTFFECQLEDGTWPLSRPLFHYPKFGNAYCYEYEMLTQLLHGQELQDLLLDYLPHLSSAVESVSNAVYRVEGGIQAWTSGHHPNQADPESWATASVYHFLHELDRLLAEAVRRALFRYVELPLPGPVARLIDEADFAKDTLDSTVEVQGKQRSLKSFLWDDFVQPLAVEADGIAKGLKFKEGTPRSAIFFGPPGTSKTELSKKIAKFVGWPHLAIDPSLVLRNGMDGMQAEANIIFRMLEETERVVVLFYEFDELVRERGSSKAEPFSRLLTTAMLPKLANIHKRATLVFIIATNHISEFDLAIRRQGRFDRVVQIMPPTYQAKMEKKDWGPAKNLDLGEMLRTLEVELTEDIKRELGELTYGECDMFVRELVKAPNQQAAISMLNNRWKVCTLQTPVTNENNTTWRELCETDAKLSQ